MNRRQYLARAGVGLGVVTLAGCLDSVSGDDEDIEVTDRTGDRALDRAVGQLNDAALALAAVDLERTDPDDVDVDVSEPRAHLEDAREYLETADDELNDRDADLEELRAYAAVLEVLIDITGLVADGALADEIEQISAALEDDGDGDLEDARETIADRTATLEDAQARFDGATSDLMALDDDRLADLAVVDLEEIESGAVELGTVLDAQVALAAGYDVLLTGYADLEEGQEHADEENHADAEAAFTDAESHFVAAADTFDDGKADAPGALVPSFETALCQSGHLEDAAVSFAAASAAAAEGDVTTAQQQQADAEAALEDARACDS